MANTILVTGAFGSIGFPACKDLAKNGHTVIMIGRNSARDRDKIEELKKEVRSQNIHYIPCDLGSKASIRSAVEEIKNKFPNLNVLINNAAAYSGTRRETKDGHELMFGVNHLAPFMFSNLLLPILKKNAPSRIINMTMGSKEVVDLYDPDSKTTFKAFKTFLKTKGTVEMFTYELAQRNKETEVSVVALNPEITQSSLPREAPLPLRLMFKFFGAKPNDSCKYLVDLVEQKDAKRVHGHFFVKSKDKSWNSRFREDEKTRKALWDLSCKLTGVNVNENAA